MAFLKNGFSTTISFSDSSTALLKNVEVTPFGIDGGNEIDLTTMSNTAYMTYAAAALKKLTEAAAVCAYDPAVLSPILSLINDNQLITIHLPGGSHTWAFWGYLKVFKPNANKINERPTAEITLVCTNMNNSDVETAPVYA